MRRPHRLSASSLAVLLDCPRCFWLQVNEDLRRPQGPFPSLPGGIDLVLKRYLDTFRGKDALPPELRGVTDGALFPEQQKLDRWRDPLRGDLRVTDRTLGVEVTGGIDDLLVESGQLTPVDFKTRGFAVKEDSHSHYEHQLDLYAWLLERLGQKVSGRGILLFFSPTTYSGAGTMSFLSEPVVVQSDTARAERLLRRAVDVLQGTCPQHHAACAFCHFVLARAASTDH